MKKILFFLLLVFAGRVYPISEKDVDGYLSETNRVIEVDSLVWEVYENCKDSVKRPRVLTKGLWAANWIGKYEKSDSLIQLAFPLFENNQDSLGLISLLIEKGITDQRKLRFEEGIKSFERAASLARRSGEIDLFLYALYNWSGILGAVEDEVKSQKILHEALTILRDKAPNSWVKPYLLLASAENLSTESDFQNKKDLLDEALLISNENNDCIIKGIILLNQIGFYSKFKNTEKALKCLDILFKNDECQGKPEHHQKLYGLRYRGAIYFAAEEYKQALDIYSQYYYKILNGIQKVDTLDVSLMRMRHVKLLPPSILPIVNCYFELGQAEKAEDLLIKGLNASRKMGSDSYVASFQDRLSKLFELKGDYEKAFFAFKEANYIRDTLNSSWKFKEIKKIQTQFQTQKHILEKQQAEEQVEKEEGKAFRNLVLAIGVGTVSLLVLLFLMKFQKQKRALEVAKKNELKQRFLRSQLSPHFSYNALVVLQSLIMEGENKQALKYLGKYAKLTRGILELTREYLISLEEELQLIGSYMELQKIKMQDKFDYVIDLDSSLDADFLKIPPMILQPIVENTIEHGFKGIDYKGELEVKVTQLDSNYFQVIIKDNGLGTNAQTNSNKSSVSTSITKERLDFYNNQSEFNITIDRDLSPNGAKVVVQIPVEI